jgi:hypothetical protein
MRLHFDSVEDALCYLLFWGLLPQEGVESLCKMFRILHDLHRHKSDLYMLTRDEAGRMGVACG